MEIMKYKIVGKRIDDIFIVDWLEFFFMFLLYVCLVKWFDFIIKNKN